MRTTWNRLGLIVLSAYLLGGCSREEGDVLDRASLGLAAASGAGSATIEVNANWDGGYCTQITVSNDGSTPITGWSLTANVHESTINNLWSGTYTAEGSTVTIVPMDWNKTIQPKSAAVLGYCASKTGSNYVPELVSLQVMGGDVSSGTGGAAGVGGANAAGGTDNGGAASGGTSSLPDGAGGAPENGGANAAGGSDNGGAASGGTSSLPGGTGGAPENGGAAAGGSDNGGAASGGTSSFPDGTGGAPENGGAAAGGSDNGGAASGGTSSWPDGTGGASESGGAAAGGVPGAGGTTGAGGATSTTPEVSKTELSITENWIDGYCAKVYVTNLGDANITAWNVTLDISSASNLTVSDGKSMLSGTSLTVLNETYNGLIAPLSAAPNNRAAFAFCANKQADTANPVVLSTQVIGGTAAPSGDGEGDGIVVKPVLTNDWGSGYCANVTVTNTRATPISDYSVKLDVGDSSIQGIWEATFVQEGSVATIDALPRNAALSAGAATTFGFCAVTTGPEYHPIVVSVTAVD